jgi:hypothetical protein
LFPMGETRCLGSAEETSFYTEQPFANASERSAACVFAKRFHVQIVRAFYLGKGSPLISALGVVDVFVEVSKAYAPGI